MCYKTNMINNKIDSSLCTMQNLAYLVGLGVEYSQGNNAINLFDYSAEQSAKTTTPPPAASKDTHKPSLDKYASPTAQTIGTNAASIDAKKIANSATTVQELIKSVDDFNGCPSLKKTASNTIFYKGSKSPSVLCIQISPTKQDEQNGAPFSANEGKLLGKMFSAIDIDSDVDVGFSSLVFWYPPGARSPTRSELAICRPFLNKLIDFIKPKIIISFGANCSNELLYLSGAMSKKHGKFFNLTLCDKKVDIPLSFPVENIENINLSAQKQHIVIPTFHPTYILNTPACKSLVWENLKAIKQFLTNQQT